MKIGYKGSENFNTNQINFKIMEKFKQLETNFKQLKKGTFRWRKKFRYLPTREQMTQAMGVDWLANRFYGLIYKHILCGGELQMLRIKEWEFVYIVNITTHYTCLEIIQKEPFQNTEVLW